MLSNDQPQPFRFAVATLLFVTSCVLASLGLASSAKPSDRAAVSVSEIPVGAWSVVPSPSNGSGRNVKSISCTSASNCWAVGYTLETVAQGFILHWNGSSWTD